MRSKTGSRRQKKRVERDFADLMNRIETGIIKSNAPNRVRVLNSETLVNVNSTREIYDTMEDGIWTKILHQVSMNMVIRVVVIETA